MFLDKNSIIIDGVSFGQYITQVEYQFPKLWGDDTGRSLDGDFSGTLSGIYPKIILTFRKLTKEEMEIVAPILDKAQQSFTYYDPVKKANTTIDTYTGDWGVVNKGMINNGRKNEGFQISFIARRKRG